MNSFTLATASIRSRPLHAVLCTSAVAAGIALLCAVFLFSQSIASGFSRNAKNIDLVVGTKGSPLQLVLSSVYHADIPAGNITMQDYEAVNANRHIKRAIPLALGDNFKGYRMVGTTPAYMELYNAELIKGKMFDAPFETVAGADTGLETGQEIAVTHGLAGEDAHAHDDHLYTVTGVLAPTGTVIDKLLVTQLESVQQLHAGHEDNHKGDTEEPHDDHEDHHAHEEERHNHVSHEEEADFSRQLTSVLVQVRSPIALMNLPRQINQSDNLLAAVPSYEIARFTQSLGLGRKLVYVLGGGFIVLSTLMLLASLASSLALRRYDLAVLRVLGASRKRLAATIMAEALLISGAGAVIGVVLGHIIAYIALVSIESLSGFVLPAAVLVPQMIDLVLIGLGLLAGLCAALVPSLSAARIDIAELLAKGRV